MSDLQDLIHTNATRAYMTGQTRGRIEERERIIKLLEPLAQHDEFCAKGCYPEDCSASTYEHAIELIKGE